MGGKRWIPVFLTLLMAVSARFVLPGFQKRTDVFLHGFSVSGDGSVITADTVLTGSMGYIRAMEAEQDGDEIHCSFYCASGGLNSRFRAKSRFEIRAGDSVETIYFDRGTSQDQLVLERDAGVWTSPSPLPQ